MILPQLTCGTQKHIIKCIIFQNTEFHRTIDELTSWLDETTATIRSSEPVDLSRPASELEAKHARFSSLHADLLRCEPRVVSLQEAADQLELQEEQQGVPVTAERQRRSSEVRRKLSLLSQKLRILINVCHVYATRLARQLGRVEDGNLSLEEIPEDEEELLPTLSNEVSSRFLSCSISFTHKCSLSNHSSLTQYSHFTF